MAAHHKSHPPPPHPRVCGGRGLAVPEVLLMNFVDVGPQIWYHRQPEERGERVVHCDSSNNSAVLPFNTLLHEFSIDQICCKVGGRHLISKRVKTKMNQFLMTKKQVLLPCCINTCTAGENGGEGKSVMHMAARLKFCFLIQACI